MTDNAEWMTLQKMWTVSKLIAPYDIWKGALKKHLCDKYAWWQIMKNLMTLEKKKIKSFWNQYCAYFLLMLLIILDDR